jgi:hypothetical protein
MSCDYKHFSVRRLLDGYLRISEEIKELVMSAERTVKSAY